MNVEHVEPADMKNALEILTCSDTLKSKNSKPEMLDGCHIIAIPHCGKVFLQEY